MFARSFFAFIVLFWVTMNVLLWRTEYGPRDPEGTIVPVERVMNLILASPDSSTLNILQNGKRIGFCQWITSVGEELAQYDEAPPEGMANKTGKYRINCSGDVIVPNTIKHARFEFGLELSTNRVWREFSVRLSLRPVSWEIRSVASEQNIHVKADNGEERFERVFRFSDLQDPAVVFREIAGPFARGLPGAVSFPQAAQMSPLFASAIKWEARRGTLRIGHEPVQVYRLQTRLLDRYRFVIFVSRVGEILRAELPDGIVLLRDPLTGF